MNLAWGDVAVDNLAAPAMVQIHLKRSKCDQEGNGADVVVGRTGSNICPVEAIRAYLRIRGPAQGRFFKDHEGRTVTKVWFTQQLRVTLQGIGLPSDQYAGHSFRIGAATSAALAGMEDSLIQTLGKWHSAAFLRYIRTPKARLAAQQHWCAPDRRVASEEEQPACTHTQSLTGTIIMLLPLYCSIWFTQQ